MTATVEGVNNSLEREERQLEAARWEDEERGGRWGPERGTGWGDQKGEAAGEEEGKLHKVESHIKQLVLK